MLVFIMYFCFCLSSLNAMTDLVYRSEYEKKGDLIYDINCPNEGDIVYSIVDENEHGHYTINSKNGEIRIATPIEDVFEIVNIDLLTVKAVLNTYEVKIVDSLDYTLNLLPDSYSV